MNEQEYFEAEQPNTSPRYQPPQKPNTMAAAAMTCGILSIVFLLMCLSPMTMVIAIPLAPTAIILALLSKGPDARMHSSARIGVISSVCSLLLFWGILISSLVLFYTSRDYRQTMYDTINQAAESMYNMDFEEMMQQLYGNDFDAEELFRLEPEASAADTESAQASFEQSQIVFRAGDDQFDVRPVLRLYPMPSRDQKGGAV